eukprot:2598531-Pleurochrysis_carterae.AAC.1
MDRSGEKIKEVRARRRRVGILDGDGRKPGGCCPSSALGFATGGASRRGRESSGRSVGRHGKRVSSKYTSEELTMLREAGTQTVYAPGMLAVLQRWMPTSARGLIRVLERQLEV